MTADRSIGIHVFTGIIQQLGEICGVRSRPQHVELSVELGDLGREIEKGDSVALDGVCLTATHTGGGRVIFDATRESLERSTLRELTSGDRVHIERALPINGRLDGHLVQGHVDTTATLLSRHVSAGAVDLRWRVNDPQRQLMVEKGSVALAGVSLTIHALRGDEVEVSLVPFSQGKTRLAELAPGTQVNVEYDLIGRYLLRSMQLAGQASGIDQTFLREHGFA